MYSVVCTVHKRTGGTAAHKLQYSIELMRVLRLLHIVRVRCFLNTIVLNRYGSTCKMYNKREKF